MEDKKTNNESKLDSVRQNIDAIDDQIIELYAKRMSLARIVGEEKNKLGLATTNAEREKDIINRMTGKVDQNLKVYAKQFYENIFATSKAYQARVMNFNSKLLQQIESIDLNSEFPVSASVACQGMAGAYSSIATEKLFKISDITYFKTFESVIMAVEKGFSNYGVLPLENSSAGSVNAVYDLMRKHKFSIVKSIKLHIRHYLLGNQGSNIEDIQEIVSHEQAFNQCNEFLKGFKNVKITILENTAVAAKYVADSKRNDIACIASKECAGIYGLKQLKGNCQDNDNNFTRFIVIGKEFEVFKNANKISMMTVLAHESGSLSAIISRFSSLGINLTKLESRPIPNSIFNFMFYFDFEANLGNVELVSLLSELETIADDFVFLGSYQEIVG